MNIPKELLQKEIGRMMPEHCEALRVDWAAATHSAALRALEQIQAAVKSETLSDFAKGERVVEIFEHFGPDAGGAHDF